MKATLLGSGTALPSTRRGSPGIVIVDSEFRVLVDAGSGTGQRLAHANVPLQTLDAIVVTHFHPDHVADLVAILFALKNPRFETERRWPVLLGPRGFGDFYARLRAPFGTWLPDAGREISLREWEGDTIAGSELGAAGFKVEAAPTAHTDNSLAYRFTHRDGGTVVCSGDSEECSALIELATDADLLFLECSFPRGQRVSGHLEPEGVSRVVRESGAKRIVLTHFYPECDNVDILAQLDEDIRSRVELGADGDTYQVVWPHD